MSQLIYNDIKSMITEVVGSSTPTDLLKGTIVNVSPIQVQIDGNSEYYPSSCFVVPEHLTDREREIEVSYEGTNTAIPESLIFSGRMKIKIFEALKVGDRVFLLQCQHGQKFLILDRLPE